jgi:hypothetical protein
VGRTHLKCSNMSRHAWAEFVESPEVLHLLWKSREHLERAWQSDQKDPKSYPLNTSFVLAEIRAAVANRPGARSIRRLTLPKSPASLSELISERTVKTIWEENHSGRFVDAIAQAAATDYKNPAKSWKVFQSIIRAIESAYLVDYVGLELLQRPKVNILHKGLNEIANAAGIGDQTEEGFAEFLDDLCPCGLKKHREAVRKLSSRSTRMRRPKA